MSFQILGTGSFAPERVVMNEDLSKYVETSDEWITKRIGVKQRHVCTTETTADMGEQAAKRALESAGVKAEELDLIIGATITPDTISPGLACMVQNRIGASCPAFDVTIACPGFLFALDVAAGFFARGGVKKALVVSAERMSSLVDWTDRGTCCIFGDGAGAAVLGQGDNLLATELHCRGGDEAIAVPTGWKNSPFYENETRPAKIFMNGQETYKFAVTAMPDRIRGVMTKAGVTGEEISLVIPHQANYRIINEARKRLPEIGPEKFCVNIDRYGNTSAASVPILLDEMNRAGKLHRGEYVVLAAFGGGLASAGALFRW